MDVDKIKSSIQKVKSAIEELEGHCGSVEGYENEDEGQASDGPNADTGKNFDKKSMVVAMMKKKMGAG